MTPDPWAFGWTQLFTLAGLMISIIVSVAGLRTFAKWKKEKLEEKRIEIAIEALALSYESKHIFNHIRSAICYPYEWEGMPDQVGDSQLRNNRAGFFAILKRIESNREYFDRAWKMQVRCAALVFMYRIRRGNTADGSTTAPLVADDETRRRKKQTPSSTSVVKLDDVMYPAHAVSSMQESCSSSGYAEALDGEQSTV